MFCIVIDNISVREVVFPGLSRLFMHQNARVCACVLGITKAPDGKVAVWSFLVFP